MTESLDKDTKRKLYAYCAYQERCKHEVRQKLRDLEVQEEEISEWLTHLEQENFLDEDRFARTYARGKFVYKRWGKLRIRQELRRKQVNEQLIQSAIRTEITDEAYRNTLDKLLQLKKIRHPLDVNEQKKLVFYLKQKGYEWPEISEALQRLKKDDK
ncbi:MAG: regulatory protein RecX [Bacteroidota bacterium]